MDELTELRQQLDILKRQLDKSAIVNEKLMVEVMKQKSAWQNGLFKFLVIVLPILVVFVFGVCYLWHINIWIAITYLIAAIADTALDYKTTRISPKDISSLDTLSLRRKLIKQKRLRFLQYLISTPLALAWSAWFVYDIIFARMPVDAYTAVWNVLAWTVIVIVVVVASIVCYVIYAKMQRTSQELIDMLEE